MTNNSYNEVLYPSDFPINKNINQTGDVHTHADVHRTTNTDIQGIKDVTTVSGKRKQYTTQEWLDLKAKHNRNCCKNFILVKHKCNGENQVILRPCGQPQCHTCARLQTEKNIHKYLPVINTFKELVLGTFTLENEDPPMLEWESPNVISSLYRAIERLKDMRIGKNSLKKLERWMSEEITKYRLNLRTLGKGESYIEQKVALQWKLWDEFKRGCEDILKSKRVNNPRFYHLLSPAIGILDVTYSPSTGFHPHFHFIMDGFHIPQILLSRIWYEVSGSSIVNIKSVDRKTASQTILRYIFKPWELKNISTDMLNNLLLVMRNRKKVITISLQKRISRKPCKCNKEFYKVSSNSKLTHDEYVRIQKTEGIINVHTKSPFEDFGFQIYWDKNKKKLQWKYKSRNLNQSWN